MARELGVAVAAGLLAAGFGAQISAASVPAYADPTMNASDSRAGAVQAPPLLPLVVEGEPCSDEFKLDQSTRTGGQLMCVFVVQPGDQPKRLQWERPPSDMNGVNATGSPCSSTGAYSASTDGYLITCAPTGFWVRGYRWGFGRVPSPVPQG